MNKLGVHAFVWAKGWSNEECARAIRNSAEVGFDLIEIAALDPKTIDVDFTRRQLEKAGIGATASLGLEANEDISSNDRENENRGQAKLERAIAMARDVGATHVCGILESAFQKYDVPTTPEGVKRSAEVLQRVAEVAARSNIIARSRGRESLRVQCAQHRLAGGRNVQADRRSQCQGAS